MMGANETVKNDSLTEKKFIFRRKLHGHMFLVRKERQNILRKTRKGLELFLFTKKNGKK